VTTFEAACAALVSAHPDLAPPTVAVSEGVWLKIVWLVKVDVRGPEDAERRTRAIGFLTEWAARRAPGVEIMVDGRASYDWLMKMVELEERLGEFPPNGAGGGAGAGHRRSQERAEMMRWEDDGGRA